MQTRTEQPDENATVALPTDEGAAGPLTTPLFVGTCLVLPILWGILVHQIFKRFRNKNHPHRPRESAWPDYQI